MKFKIFSHTHWDREWHKTAREYQVDLIEFMDDLLDNIESGKIEKFSLDGQTVVIEDYLKIKPYNKERIRNAIAYDNLRVGPWYIQPDEFVPSGESHIRNLLISNNISKEYGSPMMVGYLPDSFGQAAQIPQILNGFGIEKALFWRGITEGETKDSEFIWKSSDGSKVFTTNIRDGYGNARELSGNIDEDKQIVEKNIERLGSYCSSEYMLLMTGFDQRKAKTNLSKICEQLNKEYKGVHSFEVTYLEDYIETVFKNFDPLEIEGEFRKGKYSRVHMGIAMTRLDIKQMNSKCQTLLSKYAEPINVLSSLCDTKYPAELLENSYKYIVQNQAHDSICCVCTDATHQEMYVRYLKAEQTANMLLNKAVVNIAKNINYKREGIPLLIINPIVTARSDDTFVEFFSQYDDISILNSKGEQVSFNILEKKEKNLNDVAIEIDSKNDDVSGYQYKAIISTDIQGLGYKTYYVVNNPCANKKDGHKIFDLKTNTIENNFYKLSINDDGTLTYFDKENSNVLENLNYFTDNGNAGDEYDYSPPKEDTLITTLGKNANIEVIFNDTLMAKIRVSHIMAIPVDTDNECRSKTLVDMKVVNEITVYKNSKRIDFSNVIKNPTKNHRVSVCFNPKQNQGIFAVDDHFGYKKINKLIKNSIDWQNEGWQENYYDMYPQQKYVTMDCGKSTLGILNKGLPLFEVKDCNELSIPLLCSTDYMGKQDLIYRPGRRSGLYVPVKDSEMIGEYHQNYSIYITSTKSSEISKEADLYEAPMLYYSNLNVQKGEMKEERIYFDCENSNISMSALKYAEDKSGYILRIYNNSDSLITDVNCSINIKNSSISRVNFKEDLVSDMRFSVKDSIVNLESMNPNECITLKISIY